jgi:outer membrane lipoprotein LolB
VLPEKTKLLLGGALMLLMSACATVPVGIDIPYSRATRAPLYQLDQWAFDGRMALNGPKDAWSASISWNHKANNEQIKLSGPLGQGATVIQLTEGFVTIDQGQGRVQSSVQPEEFINQQLGMFVPVRSLRYWVVGLPEPTQSFSETSGGFSQAGWRIEYQKMQTVGDQSMPRKITVMNDQVKLKLIIEQWLLDDTKAK